MCLSTFHWKTQTFSLASSVMQIDMKQCGVLRTALAKTRGVRRMLWVIRLFLCPTEMLVTSTYVIKNGFDGSA